MAKHAPGSEGVCLPKTDPPHPEGPFKYRILLVMPTVYRLWAMTRLAQVGQCIKYGHIQPYTHGAKQGSRRRLAGGCLDSRGGANGGKGLRNRSPWHRQGVFGYIRMGNIEQRLTNTGAPAQLMNAYLADHAEAAVRLQVHDHLGPKGNEELEHPPGVPMEHGNDRPINSGMAPQDGTGRHEAKRPCRRPGDLGRGTPITKYLQ